MKNLLIDDTDVQLLLEKHRDDIGYHTGSAIADIFAGLTFGISSMFGSYRSALWISGETWGFILPVFGFAFTIYGIVTLIKSMKNNYSHQKLHNDLIDLNRISHPFSIVAIKDTFNLHPNRFLLYYDKRWNCKFFFSFKTLKSEDENLANIKQRLSNQLKIDIRDIDVNYKTERIYTKHSVSDDIDKMYDHRIYHAIVNQFTECFHSSHFTIDGTSYFWMTIAEMEQDPEIKAKNLDVVSLVKENIP